MTDAIRWVLHGGAGMTGPEDLPDDRQQAVHQALSEIGAALSKRLRSGQGALDAAQETVQALEDCQLFNAGRGSVLGRDGQIEMDAAVAAGIEQFGAVAAVQGLRNPVAAARAVLDHCEHTLLVGAGARAFALQHGCARGAADWLQLAGRHRQLREAQQHDRISLDHDESYDTVGAVVRDAKGKLALAVSTGGMTNKLPGRAGDSPLPGAGFYCDPDRGALVATGHGEWLARQVICHQVIARMRFAGVSFVNACQAAVEQLRQTPGRGGVIGISRDGQVVMEYCSRLLYRAWLAEDGQLNTAIYDN